MGNSHIGSTEGRAYLQSIGLSHIWNQDGELSAPAFAAMDKLAKTLAAQAAAGSSFDPWGNANRIDKLALAFVLDWADDDPQPDIDAVVLQVLQPVLANIDAGVLLDSGLMPLLEWRAFTSEAVYSSAINKTMQNYMRAGAVPDDAILNAYLKQTGTDFGSFLPQLIGAVKTDSIQMLRLVNVVGTRQPGSLPDTLKALLNAQIDRGQNLDYDALNMLLAHDPQAWATVLTRQARSMVIRGADLDKEGMTNLTQPAGTKWGLTAELSKLKSSNPAAYQQFVEWQLNRELSATGTIDPTKQAASLSYLKTVDPSSYRKLLMNAVTSALNAGEEITPGNWMLDSLFTSNPAEAATFVRSTLEKQLSDRGYVDNGLIYKLAEKDISGAQAIAKFAMAHAFQSGFVVPTTAPSPTPTWPYSRAESLYYTWTFLNDAKSPAAAEWKASFDAMLTTPQSDITLTVDQKRAVSSVNSLMLKWRTDDPTIDEEAQPGGLQEVDLETSLMTVFMGRATQMEAQLKSQISAVQAKNEQMGRMNEAMGLLNKVSEIVKSDAKSSDSIGGSSDGKLTGDLVSQVVSALKSAGVTPFAKPFDGSLTKGELLGGIQQLKTQIDSLGNNQQTEMIRLQSLTTKRNESFEIISSFLAKIAGVNEKILGNMR